MPLPIVETYGFDFIEARQCPCQARRRVLAAGKKNEGAAGWELGPELHPTYAGEMPKRRSRSLIHLTTGTENRTIQVFPMICPAR